MKSSSYRAIPAVEKVLQALGDIALPRPAVVAIVRRELAKLRGRTGRGQAVKPGAVPGFDNVLVQVQGALDALRRSRIQPVLNGTGVLAHTNLGRSPLAPSAVETLRAIALNYSNLEYNLTEGERGGRAAYLEHNLAVLCAAEAVMVVNNNAGALVLILRHFCSGPRREVVISRGELVQIGGEFRIPDILEASGAILREVGTTNKTALQDYARVVGKNTALILKVHRSNFFMSGFVESPSTAEIAALARRKRVPFIEDLGSGAMADTQKLAGIEREPMPAESLKHGANLVCFSGDKLLGGPQAGVIAGRGRLIAALKRDPFFRALRCDKLILSALQSTVDLYLEGEIPAAARPERATKDGIPILAMLRVSNEELRARANKIIVALRADGIQAAVGTGEARIGGGALPRSTIPSVTVVLAPCEGGPGVMAAKLRAGAPPVIGYVSDGRLKIDLRTIFPRQDEELLQAIRAALSPVNADHRD
ncbi:MAG: L-seryl-tRNA(Sec) selenium transferase [Verrucomicrobia bacterium]|nr:L-seryl-tRNA(Sec) selenium transferase [Verrucomicrobiota bacterium]